MVALCVLASSAGANSLLLHYSFDGSTVDSSTLPVDSSGNGYDATMTGFPESSGDMPVSLAGGASCLLDGGKQHGSWMDVNVADPSVLAPANYTIAFWVKPTGLGSMVIAGAYSPTGYGTEIYVRSTGEMRFYHEGLYLFKEGETGVVYDTEKWNHVAITVDTVNNVQSLYVNGALRLTKAWNLTPLTEGLTRIGNRNVGDVAADAIHGTSYRGLLDDFRFYDYPLTAAEVKTLAAPPLLHYSFDGSVASSSALTVDSSPNGYDGILTGVPVGSTVIPGSVEVGDSWQGIRGDWMDVDGVDPNALAPENYTIAFWAKPSAYAATVIATSSNLLDDTEGLAITTRGSGALRFYHNGIEVFADAQSGVVFDTEKWTHVAVSIDTVNNMQALYVDGALRFSRAWNLAPLTAGLSRIGSSKVDGQNPWGLTYQGLLDEFYFYDYAMSVEQARAVSKMKTFVLHPPNGDTIPKIMGANGAIANATGIDYFDWFGFTHVRAWHAYKGFPANSNDASVLTREDFDSAVELVDNNPDVWSAADGTDLYLDWAEFHREMEKYNVDDGLNSLARTEDIEIMLCNTEMFFEPGTKEPDDLRGDWPRTFSYWKSWYALVYYMAQNYDIEMYQFDNEPWSKDHFEAWEYNWLVAAHAMRTAMAKVNTIRAGNQLDPLKLEILGPTTGGAFWDPNYNRTMLPNHEAPHAQVAKGWGNISWDKIKYDMFGAYDPGNVSNYTMYDFHRYNPNAPDYERAIMGVRHGLTFADNDPDPTMPIVITEMNTGTGSGLTASAVDTENLVTGINIAQIMQATGSLGQGGLGAEGGMFVFKTSARRGSVGPHNGIANQFCYGSYAPTVNYGGVTRGGAALQMYTRNFRGGKQIVPHSLHNGDADTRHRVVSVVDDVRNQYYVYGSNVTGGDEFVTFDFNNLDVASGAPITVQRVGVYNTGQVTEVIALDAAKKLVISVSDLSAYLLTVPKGSAAAYETLVAPTHDKTQNVTGVDDDPIGTNPELLVSLHSSEVTERRAALMRFELNDVDTVNRALLKLSGRNVGTDQTEREILHVYAVPNEDWNEGTDMPWTTAPGVGQYITDLTYAATPTWATADGLGPMLDIEDNYGGFEVTLDEFGKDVFTPTGEGLGIYGQFVGALSFYSGDYQTNYLDVTDYIKSFANGSSADVTFLIVRIVRYKISEFSNAYYDPTDLHYDGRIVEIASKEHLDASLQPALVVAAASLPPAFNTDSINAADAAEDAAYIATLADQATDPDGDALTFSKVSGPAWLSVATDGTVSGAPGNGDVGLNAFSVQVSAIDGSDTAWLYVTVINTNDAPTFGADPIATADAATDTVYSATIGGSATDVDVGDSLSYSKVSGPAWLMIAADGLLSGTPAASDEGLNSWSVQVSDGQGGTDLATLNILVLGPLPPVFNTDPINAADATEDVVYASTLAGLASDPNNAPLSYSKVSGPAWLTVAADGSLSGTPLNSDMGLNVFSVQVDTIDGSDTAVLNITVINTNDAPTFTADPITTANAQVDAAYSTTIGGSATDVDGDALTYSKVSGPAWLTIATDGSLSGTPAESDLGVNSWSVEVSDDQGASASATLTIEVVFTLTLFSDDFSDNNRDGWYQTQVNGVRTLDTSNGYMETVSDTYTVWGAAANFSAADLSVDGNSIKLSLDFQILEDLGSATISMGLYHSNATKLTSDVADNGAGADDSGYYLYNRSGDYILKSGYATGLGNVNGSTSMVKIQPSPLATADGTWHTFSLEIKNLGGNLLITQITDEGLASEVAVSKWDTTGNITAIDQVAIQAVNKDYAIDNVAVVYQGIPMVPNSAPVFTADPIAAADAATDTVYSATISGSATDVDGDTLTYSQLSGPAWLTIAADGTLSGTPTTSDEGLNSWSVQVSDDEGDTDFATLDILVTIPSLPPVFNTDPINGADATEDSAYAGTLAGLASDPNSDPLSYSKVSGPAWLSVAADGTLSGTPGNGDVGLNVFSVQVDTIDGFDTAVLNITVINTNDAPTFTVDPINAAGATEGIAYSATISGMATDVDLGDVLTYSKVDGPVWLNVAADGALSGTPGAGDLNANIFTVEVSDANGGSAQATLNITVAPMTVHVDSITLSVVAVGGPNRFGRATVVILDKAGQPVQNATVTGTFSDGLSEQLTGTTDAAGQVVLTTTVKDRPAFSLTFTVDTVTHASYPYDAAENVVTSQTASF